MDDEIHDPAERRRAALRDLVQEEVVTAIKVERGGAPPFRWNWPTITGTIVVLGFLAAIGGGILRSGREWEKVANSMVAAAEKVDALGARMTTIEVAIATARNETAELRTRVSDHQGWIVNHEDQSKDRVSAIDASSARLDERVASLSELLAQVRELSARNDYRISLMEGSSKAIVDKLDALSMTQNRMQGDMREVLTRLGAQMPSLNEPGPQPR